MTDNRTNGQIVAKALVAHCEEHKMPFPRGSVKKIVEALRVAGRLAGEPTEAQVEAAAKAMYEEERSQTLEGQQWPRWHELCEDNPWTSTCGHLGTKVPYLTLARAALVAAHGAAPQADGSECDRDRMGICKRCGMGWDARKVLDGDFACPVPPLSTAPQAECSERPGGRPCESSKPGHKLHWSNRSKEETQMSDYREIFGRDPEPWREPLGALRITLMGPPESVDVERAQREVEELVRVLNEVGDE